VRRLEPRLAQTRAVRQHQDAVLADEARQQLEQKVATRRRLGERVQVVLEHVLDARAVAHKHRTRSTATRLNISIINTQHGHAQRGL
jgi:hypothetical protein